jgi:hypothetical protein
MMISFAQRRVDRSASRHWPTALARAEIAGGVIKTSKIFYEA